MSGMTPFAVTGQHVTRCPWPNPLYSFVYVIGPGHNKGFACVNCYRTTHWMWHLGPCYYPAHADACRFQRRQRNGAWSGLAEGGCRGVLSLPNGMEPVAVSCQPVSCRRTLHGMLRASSSIPFTYIYSSMNLADNMRTCCW
jgi:hypothetical protein